MCVCTSDTAYKVGKSCDNKGYSADEEKRADKSDPTVSNVARWHKCKNNFPRGKDQLPKGFGYSKVNAINFLGFRCFQLFWLGNWKRNKLRHLCWWWSKTKAHGKLKTLTVIASTNCCFQMSKTVAFLAIRLLVEDPTGVSATVWYVIPTKVFVTGKF